MVEGIPNYIAGRQIPKGRPSRARSITAFRPPKGRQRTFFIGNPSRAYLPPPDSHGRFQLLIHLVGRGGHRLLPAPVTKFLGERLTAIGKDQVA